MTDGPDDATNPAPSGPEQGPEPELAALPLRLTSAVLLCIFLGGALGTVARYGLETAHPVASGHFPVTTLTINLSGSLLIGFLVPLFERSAPRSPLVRPFLVVGFLGGWTTFSTLAVDADLLFKGAQAGLAVGYLAATVVGGIALVFLGEALSRPAVTR